MTSAGSLKAQGLADGTYALQMHSTDDPAYQGSHQPNRMLLEVPESVLEAVLSGGADTLTLTGPTRDTAAVMTVTGVPGTVYVMKACETSNTVLVGPRPASADQPLQTRVFSEVVESIPSKK